MFTRNSFIYFIYRCWGVQLQKKKKKKNLYRDFCGPRGSCAKSDKMPQMMLLESASTRAEDNKFDNDNKLGVIS